MTTTNNAAAADALAEASKDNEPMAYHAVPLNKDTEKGALSSRDNIADSKQVVESISETQKLT